MRAGRMRHRVSIQEKTRTPDDRGGNAVTWANVAGLVAADITPDEDGQEVVRDQQSQGTILHLVSMRYRPGITNAMRLVYRGRILTIRSVSNVGERGKELRLRCVEKIGDLSVFSAGGSLAPGNVLAAASGNLVFSGAATVAPGNPSLTATGDNGIFQVYTPGASGYTLTRSTTATYVAGP